MQINVIIPALNEESTIASTVKSALTVPGVSKVLVIDDGSVDRTAFKARKAGAEVISHIKNLGKGNALNTGISACRNADIVVFFGCRYRMLRGRN
jgi:glycosyltransferase involved in cell wall biosynthesis